MVGRSALAKFRVLGLRLYRAYIGSYGRSGESNGKENGHANADLG